ncbi:MAG TPA: hypothetical protein VJ576_05745, partial [Rhodocyclaceae bacterium]|nr:hypothetical protein [Rhodocyclaceae bacterium]
ESATAQTVGLGASLSLADTGWNNNGTDASETVSVTLTLDSPLPAGASLGSTAGMVSGSGTSYTVTASGGHTLAEAVAGLQVTVPGGWDGTLSGTISSHAYETTTGDYESPVLPGGFDNEMDDSATFSLTITDGTPSTPTHDAITVEEESMPGAGGNNETGDGLSYTVTGSFADNATWGPDGFGGIVSINGVTPVAGVITVTDTAGTLVVDAATGAYTYTLEHSQAHSEVGEDSLTLPSYAVTAQDGDGSPIGFNLNVTVVDDVPVAHVENALLANEAGIHITGDLALMGADSGGTAHVAWTTTMASLNALNLTSGGRAVTFTLSDGDSLITAATSLGTVFTLQANANGTYDLATVAPIDLSSLNLADSSISSGGGPKNTYYWYDDQTLSGDPIPGKDLVVSITGYSGGVLDTVNPSTAGIGVHNNNFDGDEKLAFDFDTTGATDGDANAAYAIRFELVNYSAGSDTFAVSGTYADGTAFTGHSTIETAGGKTYLAVTADPGQYFDIVDVSMTGGSVKLAGMTTFTLDDAPPKVLPLAFTATDADGDSASGSLSVTLQNQSTFTGSAGDDIIVGGSGSDAMTGGLGADTFVWHLADVKAGTTTDQVTDFSAQDALDLRDLVSHGASLDIDNTAHTVTATYTDAGGDHAQVVEVTILASEPLKTLVEHDGVVKIG